MTTLRVLLVEDDEDDYVITRDLLSEIDQTDYQLDWVNNSHDALTKLLHQNALLMYACWIIVLVTKPA